MQLLIELVREIVKYNGDYWVQICFTNHCFSLISLQILSSIPKPIDKYNAFGFYTYTYLDLLIPGNQNKYFIRNINSHKSISNNDQGLYVYV